MRLIYTVALVFLFSCKSLSEKQQREKDIAGNWIILYPRPDMSSSEGHQIFAQIDDSLSALNGLKLVSFTKEGGFRQLDSMEFKGKWMLTDANELVISNGGAGLDHFRAIYYDYRENVLQLKEKISVKGEPVTIVWHLKKIDKKDAASKLFGEKENKWRKTPTEIESDTEIKERVAAMLWYYAAYYKMIQGHANYFIPQRVLLPFKFYQRGMGLPKFDTASRFTRFFYSIRQAKLAHHWMDRTMTSLSGSYPSSNSYVEGYSLFMTMMAEELVGKKEEEEKESTGFLKD